LIVAETSVFLPPPAARIGLMKRAATFTSYSPHNLTVTVGVQYCHGRALPQSDRRSGDDSAREREGHRCSWQLHITYLGGKSVIECAKVLESVVVVDASLIPDGRDEGTVTAHVIQSARVPHLTHCIGGK